METNTKMFSDKVCRACLCESAQMRSLSSKIEGETRTILEMLSFVSNMKITVENKQPKQVCSDCEAILYKADAFKRRCIESEMILNQHSGGPSKGQNIENKTLIKDEKVLEINSLGLLRPLETSSGFGKPSDSSMRDIFDDISDKDEKGLIFPRMSSSKEEHVDDNKVTIRKVKKEELDNQDYMQDDDFDYSETAVPIETIPIEYKKERTVSKEIKMQSCSCGTVFKKREDYRSHLKTKKCTYRNTVKIKMEKKNSKGGRSITIKQQISCPECNSEFDTVKALKLHRKKHANTDEMGNFECSHCLRKFSRKSSYTNHMKQHDLKSLVKYTCETCKREFQHKAHLDNHILNVHTREKGYMCEVCFINFSTQETLDVHKESHKSEKKHQCKFCNKSFYMLSTLNDHLRVHTGEKPYLCSICGKGFSQKTNLAQHMRRHQGLKPFKCEECDRGFVSKGELVAHTRKHSGAHPFVCDDCGSGFTTSSSLVKHRRVHTGERPYACDLCPMRFAASGTLKNHRRTHTGEKPFQCSYCEKAFVQRHDLVSHIRGHTGERPYSCQCGQAFRKASALKAHVRLHIKDPQFGPLQPPPMLLGAMPPGGPAPPPVVLQD